MDVFNHVFRIELQLAEIGDPAAMIDWIDRQHDEADIELSILRDEARELHGYSRGI